MAPGRRCHNSPVSADSRPADSAHAAGAEDGYVEVLRVPLRWWALATMFWASVLLAFLVAAPVWVALLVPGALAALNAAVFVSYGAATVSVLDGRFRAGRAEIPVALLGHVQALDAEAAHRAAGVEADARAYLLLRPYVGGAVKVTVVDPGDPTPYWLVSTRHPRVLAEVLATASSRRG